MPVIDRHGEAIEYDLWERGDDLLDYFRGVKSWRHLRVILANLPPTSRFVISKRNHPDEAMAVARQLRELEAAGKPARYRPSPAEWDTHAELLAALVDRLGHAVALLADLPIAGKQRQAKAPPAIPRPASAVEEAERTLAMEHYEDIVSDVLEAQELYRRLNSADRPGA